jgi:hypothetical protein
MPHLAVVTVPHPLGGIDAALVRGKADAIVDRVLEALVRDPVAPAVRARTARDRVEVSDDLDAFQEQAMERGWSDGLPVLPPTPPRVARLLAGVRGERHDLIATLMPRRGWATLEAIAINAAMAGAGPEHMPVILAAVRAVADPAFNLNAILTTTHPCTPLVIVNGPVAARLGIHGGPNAFGNGHRANAVIGRALRLVLQNVAGATPGELDRATLGHPGKFTYCIAEHEAASPWAPLSVERGLAPGESSVTVVGADAPHNVNDHGSTTAEALVRALASVLATTGSNNVYLGGEPVIVLGPEHAATIAGSGWSKAELKRQLWSRAHVRLDAFSSENMARFAVIDPGRFTGRPPDATVGQALAPDDLMIVVAGGPGKHSAVVPTFGATHAVTVRIEA